MKNRKSRGNALFTVLLIMGLAFSPVTVQAATLTYTWTANTEADLAGYRLFQCLDGEAYDYTAPIAEIPVGTETCTVVDLPDGDYRFVLRAFDLAGNESGDSNKASLPIDDPPAAPVGFG